MTPLLLFITCFQFLCACAGLQQSPIYFALNPYVTLAPFFLVWLAALGFYRRSDDKNFLLIWLVIIGVQAVLFSAFARSEGFPFNFIRSMQFFWGPALLTPMLLGLFRISGSSANAQKITQIYIKTLCILAAAVTLIEVFLVWVLKVPPMALPWVSNVYGGVHRPFGIVSYPQPNAVMLAILFWLSFLHDVPGKLHRIMVFAALAVTLGATGALTFLALLPLWTRRPFLYSAMGVLSIMFVIGVATLTSQMATGGTFEKFDLAYFAILSRMFSFVLAGMLSRFSDTDLLLGSQTISSQAAIGLTHDWAYFDVFYVSGIIGLAAYLLLYGTLLYLACPREIPIPMRVYFLIVVICANFHYGTLNYFTGQVLLSVLAALNVSRGYGKETPRPSPAVRMQLDGA